MQGFLGVEKFKQIEGEPWRFRAFSWTRLRYDHIVDLREFANGMEGACTCEAHGFGWLKPGYREHPCRHIRDVKQWLTAEMWQNLMNQLHEELPPEKQTAYQVARIAFLTRHPQCAVYPDKRSENIHHSRGRRPAALVLDERFWIPVSLAGHLWVHANMAKARELRWNGVPLICELGAWETIPVDKNERMNESNDV